MATGLPFSHTPYTRGQVYPRIWRTHRATAILGPQGGAAGGRPAMDGGWAVLSHVTGAQCRPLTPPPSQVQGRVRVCTNDHTASPSSLASPRHPRVHPILGGRSERYCNQTGWATGAAAVTCGIESAMGQGGWNPAPRPWSGSGTSLFLPGFGARSPETRCLGTGTTPSCRN